MKTHKAAVALVAVAFTVGMASMAVAQDTDSDDSEFNVTVDEQTIVKVNPSALEFAGMNPGERRDQSTDTELYEGVEVENSGSTTVDQVWATTTLPTSNPFGTGSATAYNSGNFIMASTDGEGPTTEVNYDGPTDRVEFNDDGLSYVVTDENSGEGVHYGRIRVEEGEEFFWHIDQQSSTAGGVGGSNFCAGDSTANFRIGNNSQKVDDIGSVDFGTSSQYEEYPIYDLNSETGDSDYGLVNDVTINPDGGPERTFDVLTFCEDASTSDAEAAIIWGRWNPEMGDGFNPDFTASALVQEVDLTGVTTDTSGSHPDGSDSAATTYIGDTDFQPGEHFLLETAVEVPLGVAAGDIDEGNLIVNVRSN